MKKIIVAIAASTLVTACTSTSAEPYTSQDFCADAASIMHSVAKAHQRGVSQEKVLSAFAEDDGFPEMAEVFREGVRELYSGNVPRATTPAGQQRAADVFAISVYLGCMKNMPTAGETI